MREHDGQRTSGSLLEGGWNSRRHFHGRDHARAFQSDLERRLSGRQDRGGMPADQAATADGRRHGLRGSRWDARTAKPLNNDGCPSGFRSTVKGQRTNPLALDGVVRLPCPGRFGAAAHDLSHDAAAKQGTCSCRPRFRAVLAVAALMTHPGEPSLPRRGQQAGGVVPPSPGVVLLKRRVVRRAPVRMPGCPGPRPRRGRRSCRRASTATGP